MLLFRIQQLSRRCVLPHCPSASTCLFPEWGQDECESEVHNYLGFAYRSDTSDPAKQEEYMTKGYAHYHKSLSLNSRNCGTWGYLGQMFALQQDQLGATICMDALCSLQVLDSSTCPQSSPSWRSPG